MSFEMDDIISQFLNYEQVPDTEQDHHPLPTAAQSSDVVEVGARIQEHHVSSAGPSMYASHGSMEGGRLDLEPAITGAQHVEHHDLDMLHDWTADVIDPSLSTMFPTGEATSQHSSTPQMPDEGIQAYCVTPQPSFANAQCLPATVSYNTDAGRHSAPPMTRSCGNLMCQTPAESQHLPIDHTKSPLQQNLHTWHNNLVQQPLDPYPSFGVTTGVFNHLGVLNLSSRNAHGDNVSTPLPVQTNATYPPPSKPCGHQNSRGTMSPDSFWSSPLGFEKSVPAALNMDWLRIQERERRLSPPSGVPCPPVGETADRWQVSRTAISKTAIACKLPTVCPCGDSTDHKQTVSSHYGAWSNNFKTYTEARGYMETPKWRCPDEDETIPQTDEECLQWARQLYEAIVDCTHVHDNFNSRGKNNRLLQAKYKKEDIEASCWNCVNETVNLHLRGATLPAASDPTQDISQDYSPRSRKEARNHTFADRMTLICNNARWEKTYASDIVERSEIVKKLVYAPAERAASKKGNRKGNMNKEKLMREGKKRLKSEEQEGEGTDIEDGGTEDDKYGDEAAKVGGGRRVRGRQWKRARETESSRPRLN